MNTHRLNTLARMAGVALFIWVLNHFFPRVEEVLATPAMIFCGIIIVAATVVYVSRWLRRPPNA
jgi:hypothetical protein